MKEKEQLLQYINEYLVGNLSLPDFWKRYNFYWADIPEEALDEHDYEFFFEVNEHLHYTDWQSSADPALTEASAFRKWLTEKLEFYK